jgi:Tol biopolymer transport system component
MRERILWLANGIVVVGAIVLVLATFAYRPGHAVARQNLPGPAVDSMPAVGLAFVTFSGNSDSPGDAAVTTQAIPVADSGDALTNTAPQTLFSQTDPPECQTDQLIASPNGRTLATQYLCHANTLFQLSNLVDLTEKPVEVSRGYFLNWSPDGNWLLFREIDDDNIWLMSADGREQVPLDLPFGTYGAVFTPDGQRVIYTASRGLGFGSEMGGLNLVNGQRIVWQTDPYRIFAFPALSADGSHLAYISMPDSNIPFTVGELWLADGYGNPQTMLDNLADAGRGYPPAWSPDGRTVAFVRRENPEALLADQDAYALHSNIYQVEAMTGQMTQLTHFEQSMVYDITWSPDGRQLAFTAQNAIWMMEPGQSPIQISQPNSVSRHPAWLVEVTTP